MKKLFAAISMILCAAMLTAPFSSAETPDVYTIYKRAAKKMNAATSVEMVRTSKIVDEWDGQAPGEVEYTTTIKQVTPAGGKPEIEQHSKGPSDDWVSYDIYYKDGYYYSKSRYLALLDVDVGYEGPDSHYFDKKIKLKAGFDEINGTAHDLGMNFTKDDLAGAAVEVLPKGGYKLKFKVKGGSAVKRIGYAPSSTSEFREFGYKRNRVGDVSYILTIGPDYQLKSSAFAFSILFTGDNGPPCKTKYTITNRIVSVNQPLKIVFPGDLDTYTEY